MEIKTKFNIGDEVWVFIGQKIYQGKIKQAKLVIEEDPFSETPIYCKKEKYLVQYVWYTGSNLFKWIKPVHAFKTKEELVNSIFN